MKRVKSRWLVAVALLLLVLLVVILLFLRACAGTGNTADAKRPTVVVTKPDNNSVFYPGQVVTILADAHAGADLLTSVQILINSSPLQTLQSAPYTTNWTPFETGEFQISAVVKDKAGKTSSSVPVLITVKQAASPGASTPPTLTLETTDIPWRSWPYLPTPGFWGVYGSASRSTPGIVSLVQKLKFAKFPATVVYTKEWSALDPGPYYVVFIGPYSTEALARLAQAKASAAGFGGMYVRFSGPRR